MSFNFDPRKPLPRNWRTDLRQTASAEDIKKVKKFNFLYPNHNYLGPGNKAPIAGNSARPVDIDDEIAAKHDNAYHLAKTKEDIYNADIEAIREFGKDAINNLNHHSAIGAVGLGIKHGAERLTNRVFYPNLTGNMPRDHLTRLVMQEYAQKKPFFSYKYKKNNAGKRGGDAQPGPSRESKQPRIESTTTTKAPTTSTTMANQGDNIEQLDASDTPMDVQADEGMATGSSGGAGGKASGVRGTVQMPRGHPIRENRTENTYTQQYKFRIKSALVEYQSIVGTGFSPSYVNIKYPYHDLPVHMLGFYLDRETIIKLRRECTSARVKHAKVEVYCYQAQLPFVTGLSTSGIANNNIGYYLNKIDPAIQNYRQGVATNMETTVVNSCWGKHVSELPASNEYTTLNLGELSATYVTKSLDTRFAYQHIQNAASNGGIVNQFTYKEHAFPIDKFIEKRWNASFQEGLFCTWEHSPSDGLWHQLGKTFDQQTAEVSQAYNLKRDLYTLFRNGNNTTGTYMPLNVIGSSLYSTAGTNNWQQYTAPQMPKNQRASLICIEHDGMKAVPPLIMGLQPIVTGNISSAQGDLVDAQLTIEVHTTLIMDEVRGNAYMTRFGGNTVQPDPVRGKLRTWMYDGSGNATIVSGAYNNVNRNGFVQASTFAIQDQPEPDISGPTTNNSKFTETKLTTTDEAEVKEEERLLEEIQHKQIRDYLTNAKKQKKVHQQAKKEKKVIKRSVDTVKKALFNM